ncbi:MAG: hypothetical protein ABJG15_08200 [Hyphomonadaceae bacterium]
MADKFPPLIGEYGNLIKILDKRITALERASAILFDESQIPYYEKLRGLDRPDESDDEEEATDAR